MNESNNQEVSEEQKEKELKQFEYAYRLTLNHMAILVRDANKYQTYIKEAKTTPKRTLYENKFKNTKQEFQDELKRLIQLEHILKENDVDPTTISATDDLKNSLDQLTDFTENSDGEADK